MAIFPRGTGTANSSNNKNNKTQRFLWILALLIIFGQQMMIQMNSICFSTSPWQWTGLDAPTATTTTATTAISTVVETKNVKDFERVEGVVIVSKLHGEQENIDQLIQSLCLLKVAYNNRMNYDHVLFSTLPIPISEQNRLIDIVSPAKISFYNDTIPLQDALQAMTSSQKEHVSQMCNVSSIHNITWQTWCHEKCKIPNESCYPTCQLQYLWQAEFRSKHIWSHPALNPYRYMIWWDSDALPMKVWKFDPIASMVRNNVKFLFDNFPMGGDGGIETHTRIRDSFGHSICSISLNEHGQLVTTPTNSKTGVCDRTPYPMLHKVHGFFHITDLQLYRSPTAMKWYTTMIGDSKFARKWDDQLAVTLPGAMMAPNQSWDMRTNGIILDVMHNGRLDGKPDWKIGWYIPFWNNLTNFPEARPICSHVITSGGR